MDNENIMLILSTLFMLLFGIGGIGYFISLFRIYTDNINDLRIKYGIGFIMSLFISTLFVIINPNGIMNKGFIISLYVSLFIIFLLSYLSTTYKISHNNDNNTIFYIRQNLWTISLAFIAIIINILILNPYDVVNDYGIMIYTILSISICLSLGIFMVFSGILDIPGKTEEDKNKLWEIIYSIVKQIGLVSLFIIISSVVLLSILKIFDLQDADKQSVIGKISIIVFMILIFIIIIVEIKKYIEIHKEKNITIKPPNKITLIFMKMISNLSYFFNNGKEYIINEYKNANKIEKIMLAIEITIIIIIALLSVIYPFISKKIYMNGGKQLVYKAIGLEKEHFIGNEIEENDKKLVLKYNFTLSFWFYIDSVPPNTDISYDKYTNILSYADRLFISYNPSLNKLKIYTLNPYYNSQKIIYSINEVKLQRWHNMVIVYDGGIIDIFYNNKLLSSVNNIIEPNIMNTSIIIGSDRGLSGGLCNLMYFHKNIDLLTLNTIYENVKDKNNPIGDYKFL